MSYLIFKDLGTDEELKFIAWIGDVNSPILNGTATINVLLYPLKKEFTARNFTGRISELEYWRRQIVQVDVGLLPLIRIGQLVKKGKIVSQAPSHFTALQFNVKIDKQHKYHILPVDQFYLSMAERSKKGKEKENQIENEKIKYKVYDFPLLSFPGSEMICLRKGIEQFTEFDLILLPCTESISFYFCTSDNLSQELFTGGLQSQTNTIFNSKYITPKLEIENGVLPHVRLRYRIPDEDYKIVGRIAYSPEAMRSALAIYNSLRRGTSNASTMYPVTLLPFSGESNLQVCGRSISSNGYGNEYTGQKIFLIYNILSCTGEFPFKELTWSRDNDGTSDGDGQSSNNSNWPNQNGQDDGENDDKDKNINSQSGHNKNLKRLSTAQYEERFLFKVTGKKITFGKEALDKPYVPPSPSLPTDDFTSSPDSDNDSNSGDLESKTDTDNKKENEPKEHKVRPKDKYEEHFNEVINLFRSTGTCNVINLSKHETGYIFFEPNKYLYTDPLDFSFRSYSYKWSTAGFLKNDQGRKEWQGSRAAIATLITENISKKNFLLIEVLKTETEKSQSGFPIICLYSTNTSIFTFDFVQRILKVCAKNEGVSLDNHPFKELEREFINHYFDHGATTTFNSTVSFLSKFGFTFTELKKKKNDNENNKELDSTH